MTNGEVIQKVFNCEVCEPIIEDDIIHVIFADKKGSTIAFDLSWWNAEYEEPITCEYCKHRVPNDVGDYYCDISGGYYDPDYHCEYAERK